MPVPRVCGRIGTKEVVLRVKKILNGMPPALTEGFNRFLPPDHQIRTEKFSLALDLVQKIREGSEELRALLAAAWAPSRYTATKEVFSATKLRALRGEFAVFSLLRQRAHTFPTLLMDTFTSYALRPCLVAIDWRLGR